MRLWDISTLQTITLFHRRNTVLGIGWSPGGGILASAGDDKTIRLWNPAKGEEIMQLKGHENSVSDVAWNSDGALLASISLDKTIRLWDLQTRKELHRLEGHIGGGWEILFVPSHRLLVSKSNFEVLVWHQDTYEILAKLPQYGGHKIIIHVTCRVTTKAQRFEGLL